MEAIDFCLSSGGPVSHFLKVILECGNYYLLSVTANIVRKAARLIFHHNFPKSVRNQHSTSVLSCGETSETAEC